MSVSGRMRRVQLRGLGDRVLFPSCDRAKNPAGFFLPIPDSFRFLWPTHLPCRFPQKTLRRLFNACVERCLMLFFRNTDFGQPRIPHSDTPSWRMMEVESSRDSVDLLEPKMERGDQPDELSLAEERTVRFLMQSGAVLSGRIDGDGRRVEANAVLDRLLRTRATETIEGLLKAEDVGAWRKALREIEIGANPVEINLSIEPARGGFLALRVLLEPLGPGSIRFLAVPEDDVFEAIHKLSIARDAARRGLQRRGRIDSLTGLGDRGRADHWLNRCVTRALRSGESLACVMVDLDFFKAVNDSLGHLEGDRRLRAASKVLASLSPPGLAARFGGDEFLVLWPGLNSQDALQAAEGLRQSLQAALSGGTASIGLACLRDGDEPASLLARADSALVRAKRMGRNRVEFEP